MILCLDMGNSKMLGGVFCDDQILLRFRHNSRQILSSDQWGIFLRQVLHENSIDIKKITQIAICSVVPAQDYSLRAACRKYFNILPFVLQSGVKTGLKIKYRNPVDIGADRIANAVAAVDLFPQQNLIIIDLGTATTFCVITKNKEYLGGIITAGIHLTMDALQANTAKLSAVEIIRPKTVIGRSTTESIQSGIYYTQVGFIKEAIHRIKQEIFKHEEVLIIGTGGFSHLFSDENIFDLTNPELVLHGLRVALRMNSANAIKTVE